MGNFLDCEFCDKPVDCNESFEQYTDHKRTCDMRPISVGDIAPLVQQVAEMHAVIKGLAEALNNPMLKAMLPPPMRGMLGG